MDIKQSPVLRTSAGLESADDASMLKKREEFAVSLRKTKKQKILGQKRQKLLDMTNERNNGVDTLDDWVYKSCNLFYDVDWLKSA